MSQCLDLLSKDNDTVYNYEYFQQEDVCRLCWNKNAATDISFKNIHKNPEKTLSNKIKECLDIDISENTFPKRLCAFCCQQIEKMYYFKKFYQETDKKLQDIINKYFKSSQGVADVVKAETEEFFKTSLDKVESKEFIEFEALEKTSESTDEDTKPELRTKCIKSKTYLKRRTPTYCNICRTDLIDTNNFVKHNSEYHGIHNGLYKCFGCQKTFKNRKARLSHEHHFCKGLADGYKCGSCSRFLPNRRHYETHMRDHRQKETVDLPEDIFKCRHCLKLFKSKEELSKHSQQHNAKKNFVCEKCGRVFTRQDYLYKHKVTHTGEKHHVCPHCNFRTTQRSSLVVHIRRHTGERPYKCEVCPQRCVSSSNLIAHRRKHLGLKHHECTICGKKFAYKATLAEHVGTAHAPAPRPCPHCAAQYVSPRALARHVRAKHPQQRDVQQVKSVQQVQVVQHNE